MSAKNLRIEVRGHFEMATLQALTRKLQEHAILVFSGELDESCVDAYAVEIVPGTEQGFAGREEEPETGRVEVTFSSTHPTFLIPSIYREDLFNLVEEVTSDFPEIKSAFCFVADHSKLIAP